MAEIEHEKKRDQEVDHISQTANSGPGSTTGQTMDDVTALDKRLANPLEGKTHAELEADAERFANEIGLTEHVALLRKGAVIAQDPSAFEVLPQLTEEDKEALRRETTHRWSQPFQLFALAFLCSMAAAVQGMDETVINGANLFFPQQFGISTDASVAGSASQAATNQWILGLVNGAPYLCCAVLGCWLTAPLNHYFGRRGTIFITATLSFLTCVWSGVTNSWGHLFAARFVLGLGIGPKSSTVPVYSAECAPANIRGAMVMMWQMWTAFGIMFGYISSLVFYHVGNKPHITGLGWRLMLGSAGLPALFVMAQVFMLPESPRWLMKKGRYTKAYESLCRLRNTPLQAARDLYYIHVLLKEEENVVRNRNLALELFTIPRVRRATIASGIVMFMQQFCGVNVIAYYSSTIFQQGGFSVTSALLGSWGFGAVNFLFAIPAIYTIDTFGRRNLLLTTFPAMAVCLVITGAAFHIHAEHARIGVVCLGIYLYGCFYSPGEGPVPFTYSAEAFPLYIREVGMSWATAVCWLFNFVVALTFPRLLSAFTPMGAFFWYAAWNIVGFFLILLFVPETKSLSLEELDQVFNVPTHKQARYGIASFWNTFDRYVLRRNVPEIPPPHDDGGYIHHGKRNAGLGGEKAMTPEDREHRV
ncbi:hypothetical protein DL93DRAFT_2165313 [Clavulina sp. PMI_390]|nr:hypothetical protein DL93DRAFT_2165313 [Clavulina sp. PMI_390]